MLSQMNRLSLETEGRYATDAELQFIIDYAQSFPMRLQTYQTLQELESSLVEQTHTRMKAIAPQQFQFSSGDMSAKWKRDTGRVLRYTAAAVLMNDSNALRERFLLWFQTIMRAFAAQQSCNLTYQVMQEVTLQHLTPPQVNLVNPVLEINRRSLGMAA
ncbi:MAG TPA: phycobilisome protein [Trichocoleus sp.]|jgi:hypothetical protein